MFNFELVALINTLFLGNEDLDDVEVPDLVEKDIKELLKRADNDSNVATTLAMPVDDEVVKVFANLIDTHRRVVVEVLRHKQFLDVLWSALFGKTKFLERLRELLTIIKIAEGIFYN